MQTKPIGPAQKSKISYGLHVLLTLCTGGLWLLTLVNWNNKTAKWIGVVVGAYVLLLIVVGALHPMPKPQIKAAPHFTALSPEELAAKDAAEKAAFSKLAPAIHITEAKKLIASDDLDEALDHLVEIQEGAKEYKAAQVLKKTIYARREKQVKQEIKAAHAMYKDKRVEIADKLDTILLGIGVNVQSVKATGDEKTTLAIDYSGCDRVFMQQVYSLITKIDGFEKFGFKKAVCYGYDSTTTTKLE